MLQASGAWLLYKSNTREEGFLFATLKGFSVFDDREGTKEQFRLAIGKSATIRDTSSRDDCDSYIGALISSKEGETQKELDHEPTPSMLILDATFRKSSTNVSICFQRPRFLVALDFLLAIAEFFVPSVRSMLLSDDDKDTSHMVSAIVFDDQIYSPASSIFSISPQKPLIVDDERFDHFIYDGKGGKLYLEDRDGKILRRPTHETIIYVANGKRLQFKNVTIVVSICLKTSVLSSFFLSPLSSYVCI